MKVVLFCGGLGLRIRGLAEDVPKPLVRIGDRPILWNLMRYYAHFGHTDFVLCLGYRGEAIRDFFRSSDEIPADWRVTFVDTGLDANIATRLCAVREHVEHEPLFLANYADGLTDLPLDSYLAYARERGRVATLLSVPSPQPLHIVQATRDGHVRRIQDVGELAIRINGGFFVFRPKLFDYIEAGEELVVEPFRRLIRERELLAYDYAGFWQNMDTWKDHRRFEEWLASGDPPWEVWR